jgi:ribose/xylose/arabinose/galactoside ABC-type transport system permease subunit
MLPRLRKFVLTTHITLSVGWIGAVCAYLVLVVMAMSGQDTQTLHAAWIAMGLIGWYILVPFALASLLTGLVMSLGTRWGLFRHYWVLTSFALTLVATVVLLQHMRTVSAFAHMAAEADRADVGRLRGALWGELLHAGVGLLVLLTIEMLNVYKPQGMTAYGRRRMPQGAVHYRSVEDVRSVPGRKVGTGIPRWARVVGIHAAGLALLLAIIHLASGGLQHH